MGELKKRALTFFQSLKMRPLTLAPYLVVLLFVANEAGMLYRHFELPFWSTVMNAIVLLCFAFLVHFFCSLIFIQRYIATIIAAFVLFVSLFYFDLYAMIYEEIPWVAQHITKAYNVFLLIGFLLIGALLWVTLRPFKEKLRYVNNYLIVILSIFILIEVGKTLLFKPFNLEFTNLPEQSHLTPPSDSCDFPDIYYIIFDSYTASRSLQTYWNYSNPLDTLLSRKGFYIASKSNTNYNGTNYSIASSLNMSYLNVKVYDEDLSVPEIDYNTLPSKSIVADYLRQSGYQIKAYTLFDFMGVKNIYEIDNGAPNFFRRTLFFLLQVKLGKANLSPFYVEKQRNLAVLDSLKVESKRQTTRPKFVYAHVYLPHPPFFFDEAGNSMENAYAFGDYAPEKYLAQLKYTNTLIDQTMDEMLRHCKDRAIIIIQGDHGYRFIKNEQQQLNAKEAASIFNAYYFPDQDYQLLYDSISPVNSFRVILNKHFGTQLPLLPDTNYYLQEEKGFVNLRF